MNMISVRSEGEGWIVESDALGFPGVFTSGGHAERFALLHAKFRAEGGLASEVRVFLRDGSLAARLSFPATCDAASAV